MITYPYIPKDKIIKYVDLTNQFMRIAKSYAFTDSLDKVMPNAGVLVKNNKVIGIGANGNHYHETHICERIKLNISTGQGYELCEGCHPKNHGESKSIADAQNKGNEVNNADLYLWGHWWCCEACWEKIIKSNIKDVFLLINSENLFNKSGLNNLVGRQFEDYKFNK